MTKILIIHGWEGNPNIYWIPKAKEKLENEGYKVYTPMMPGGYFPIKAEWLKVIEDYQPDKEWVLIGHSLGGVAILKFLEKAQLDIKKAVLIATPFEPMKFSPIANFFDPGFDWKKIKSKCLSFSVLNETDDPVVPCEHGKRFAKYLGITPTEVPGASHCHNLNLDLLEKLIDDKNRTTL